MPTDDRLDTQTAAPPAVPPKRPIVVAAAMDEDDLFRLQPHARQIAELKALCDVLSLKCQAGLRESRAALDRLDAWEARNGS